MGNGVWLVGSRGMLGTEVGEALGARWGDEEMRK